MLELDAENWYGSPAFTISFWDTDWGGSGKYSAYQYNAHPTVRYSHDLELNGGNTALDNTDSEDWQQWTS